MNYDEESDDEFLSPPPHPDTSWIGARLSPIGSIDSEEHALLTGEIKKRKQYYLPYVVIALGTIHLTAITIYDRTIEQQGSFMTSFVSQQALRQGGALTSDSILSLFLSLTLCISWYDLLFVIFFWSTILRKSRMSPNIIYYAVAHNSYAFLLDHRTTLSGALLASTVAALVQKAQQRPTHRFWLLLFCIPLYMYHLTPFHSIMGVSGACLAAIAYHHYPTLVILVLAAPLLSLLLR